MAKKIQVAVLLSGLLFLSAVYAAEFHVATSGKDDNAGTAEAPFRTIQHAADVAQPGDTVTVHQGVYRERINPPRGGESDAKRIVYQAAPGEKVTITGSEEPKGWEKVQNDTWKLVLPNTYFGKFNPYAEKVSGDWFSPNGRVHRRGNVYRDGQWLAEAPNLDAAMQPAGTKPLWFATADGVVDAAPAYLLNIAWLKPGAGAHISAVRAAARQGTQNAGCSEGGQCVGFISQGYWLRYDNVDFGTGTETVEFRAAATVGAGGIIELRDGLFDGPLLGTCSVQSTGDWQKWQTFTAKIEKTAGMKTLCLVFKSTAAKAESAAKTAQGNMKTTIYAQFPGLNPNEGAVEIGVRPTVFTPEKTNIDYITVRGFDLRNAATNWAAPTSGQNGLVTAYWCKGWIIENNEIHHSRCCGIALAKYADEYDNKRGTKEGYDGTIADALKSGGWTKEKIGSHIVRNNHIHHCGQTGIVGSLGCAFSRIEQNEIHDINLNQGWGGAEMAGIKFHGAIDVVIKGNHIYQCGQFGGLWLDWMAQGTQILGNLFHDNAGQDIYTEVNHGPFLFANNIMLSRNGYWSNSQGGAYVHNLILGSFRIGNNDDSRQTPYHKAHSTELAGRHDCPTGDVRWYNNLLASQCNLNAYDHASLPVTAAGNVFTKGAAPSKFDAEALLKPKFDAGVMLVQKADGWYLGFAADLAWAKEQNRQMVNTELLGKAKIPDQPFDNPDGSPLKIDTDYFGKPRNHANPFPGPFETVQDGKQEIKVWPK